jgi:hypothetical protein
MDTVFVDMEKYWSIIKPLHRGDDAFIQFEDSNGNFRFTLYRPQGKYILQLIIDSYVDFTCICIIEIICKSIMELNSILRAYEKQPLKTIKKIIEKSTNKKGRNIEIDGHNISYKSNKDLIIDGYYIL